MERWSFFSTYPTRITPEIILQYLAQIFNLHDYVRTGQIVFYIMPTLTLMAFTGFTNAYGP